MTEKKRGILLMNLGSPDSTDPKDVKRYLDEFLMDGKVIDVPYLLRLLIVKGFITPRRSHKSAEAYQTIWTEDGSPLIVITRQLQAALQEQVQEPVEIAMRYGNPSPEEGFNKLMKRQPDLDEVVAVPLYPHYAMSSYETAVDHATEAHAKNQYPFKLTFVEPYYKDEDYIGALAESIRPYLDLEHDHMLFSYHGVPGRHIRKSDTTSCHCLKVEDCCNVPSPAHATCYRHQCFTTTKLVTQRLGIAPDKFSIAFQSRLGKGWLQPFTDVRLKQMPAEGIKKLLILCPAFVSDCLETLEEIAERGKEDFIEAGGEAYHVIPCMNVQQPWVQALKKLVEKTG